MKRSMQNINDLWDLEKIYKDTQQIDKDIKECSKLVENLVENKETMFDDIHTFEETMDNLFKYEILITKAYTYAHHKLDEEISNQESQMLFNKVYAAYIKNVQALNFFVPYVLKNSDKIESYLEDAKFAKMRKYFHNILRFKKYTLSEKEEQIITYTAEMSALPYKVFNSLVDTEFDFGYVMQDGKEVKLTQGNYNNFITHSNQDIRRQAFENLYVPFAKHNITLANLYNGQINTVKFNTKVRGFASNLDNALFSANISSKVYKNIVNAVNENISINHEYVKYRKNKLQLSELHLYDMYVPLIPSYDKDISFEESQDIILKSLSIFGDDYVNVLKQAFDKRWIDKYENEDKRSGAYSGGMYLTPPYILLNYSNKINDLYTLAHELGHSLHTYFTNKNQEYYNSSYKIFIAEVASIVNELILTDYLIENSSDKMYQAYIINYMLEQYRTTLIRQTMFAEFELATHQKVEESQELTADEFNDIYYKLNQRYFGDAVEIDEQIKYEWSRIPHFYYNFYVYQYATSFCVAIKVVNMIKDDKSNVGKYLEFLKLGDSVYPMDALKSLGIDLSEQSVFDEAMKSYGKMLDKFKEIYV